MLAHLAQHHRKSTLLQTIRVLKMLERRELTSHGVMRRQDELILRLYILGG